MNYVAKLKNPSYLEIYFTGKNKCERKIGMETDESRIEQVRNTCVRNADPDL